MWGTPPSTSSIIMASARLASWRRPTPETLHGWFGKVGYSLSAFARGLDASPVAKQDHVAAVKSVGNSGTTPRDLVNNEDVWLMLLVMAESVAMRMRELNMKCTVVEVSVRTAI